ncbi:hypothetical protein [Verrucosispora sp. NA02020]|uniref:hypothetical protein n=1 Tax=Verrucosispora sp. NA02020 TaxID=2742132 RepID=UPI001592A91D|nr:hypothetical protein [Verrucosispora sp. NA02020]QKW14935.1 hypothetical protein HUT12_20580 [Verrucosispora sp. NA02020]
MTGPLYLPTESSRPVPADPFGRPVGEWRPERVRGGRAEGAGGESTPRHVGPTVGAVPADE